LADRERPRRERREAIMQLRAVWPGAGGLGEEEVETEAEEEDNMGLIKAVESHLEGEL
jgi:hypothetical protein